MKNLLPRQLSSQSASFQIARSSERLKKSALRYKNFAIPAKAGIQPRAWNPWSIVGNLAAGISRAPHPFTTRGSTGNVRSKARTRLLTCAALFASCKSAVLSPQSSVLGTAN